MGRVPALRRASGGAEGPVAGSIMTPTSRIGARAAAARRPRGMIGAAIPLGILLLGLALVHYRFVLGRGTQIPGGRIDTAFLHYVLEHEYQWLHGGIVHQSFWDPAFSYPQRNSLAYSELLIGVLPFYAVWRALGFDPGGSYQLWFVSLSILNFLAMYGFLRKVMELRGLPSALGAYFFAFGSPRVNELQAEHAQLWFQFYVVLAVWFLIRFLQLRTDAPRGKAVLWLSLASAAVALQLISCFYFGWFLCFSLMVALGVSLIARGPRQALFGQVRRFWPALIAAAAVFICLTGFTLEHYLAAAGKLNLRGAGPDAMIMPTLGSWIYAGDNNLLYSWIRWFPRISRVGRYWERANGVGVITGILVLAGAIWFRRRPVFRPIFLASVVVLALTFTLPGGWTLWQAVYRSVPAAPAVRVVARWGVFLLFPFSIALAACLDRIYASRGWAPAALLGAVVVLEQFNFIQHYDFQAFQRRALNYIAQLKPQCNSFLVSGASDRPSEIMELQVASMWAQLVSGVATVNGYSGYFPEGYPFLAPVATGVDYAHTLDGISKWQKRSPAELLTCWLRPDPGAQAGSSAPLRLEIVSPGTPSPVEKFVRWSYVGILGRLPRPDEAASAQAALDGRDGGRARLILSLIQTPEARRGAFAEKAYLSLLDRDADKDAWRSLSPQLASGRITEQDVAGGILRSEEYRNRSALPGGSLPHFASPAEIAGEIESGPRGNRTAIGLMYLYLLGRPPVPREAAFWTRQLDRGLSSVTLVEYILDSQEYETLGGAN